MLQRFDAIGFLDGLFKEPQCRQPLGISQAIISADDLPERWREYYIERAAIREYEGGQAREHAEAEALRETIEAMKHFEASLD
jgi:hypothetical protein